MPDLSNSPKPSFTMRRYCLRVALASGKFIFLDFARSRAMPESFAA
jgi:hypothetical protein